ncbi:hypothetical protein KC640_03380 [Candidatus Dojkabacteria bacterium]|uniref:Uncharacterized protein n=1 Tax=Candidatus Dojkabacteria bacterium TaxID=2099670 RepID=A0A955I818_9BACT|nr:hypothetical protein [Candidatus Dojkabacteria bacterium]
MSESAFEKVDPQTAADLLEDLKNFPRELERITSQMNVEWDLGVDPETGFPRLQLSINGSMQLRARGTENIETDEFSRAVALTSQVAREMQAAIMPALMADTENAASVWGGNPPLHVFSPYALIYDGGWRTAGRVRDGLNTVRPGMLPLTFHGLNFAVTVVPVEYDTINGQRVRYEVVVASEGIFSSHAGGQKPRRSMCVQVFYFDNEENYVKNEAERPLTRLSVSVEPVDELEGWKDGNVRLDLYWGRVLAAVQSVRSGGMEP